MDLLLVRHAKAAESALYANDDERPLSAEGRRAAREVGRSLAGAGVAPDTIVVSPLVRAVETAELIAVELGFEAALEVSGLLRPEGRPAQIFDILLEPRAGKRVALVGHEPLMGRLLSVLLGRPGLALSRGAAVRVEREGERGRLVFVVTPRRLQPNASLDAL